jgi:KaiC/GvpD/RAD55 family RecA-like ATPase
MSSNRFLKARRQQSRLRSALDGPPGSGKTFTALRFAHALGGRVALIDTENGSASKYAGDTPDGIKWDFDVLQLASYAPTEYSSAIEEAGREGYDVLVIDSLSHAWAGKDGALEIKDRQGGNSFTAWKNVTPMHNRMVEAILSSPCHVIATLRSKIDYVIEEEVDERGRKKAVPRKVGLAPVQRPGMEYEFDVYGSLDWSHILTVTKSRCPAVADAIVSKPGPAFMEPILRWLRSGEVVAVTPLPRRASAEQVERIVALVEKLKITPQTQKSALATYGVDAFPLLTEIQATEIETRLNERLAKLQKATVTENGTSTTPANPSSPTV